MSPRALASPIDSAMSRNPNLLKSRIFSPSVPALNVIELCTQPWRASNLVAVVLGPSEGKVRAVVQRLEHLIHQKLQPDDASHSLTGAAGPCVSQ